MLDHDLPSVAGDAAASPVHAVRPGAVGEFLGSLPPAQAAFVRGSGFAARADELVLLPDAGGVAGAVLGLGADRTPFAFGSLAFRLPEGNWRIVAGDFDASAAVLGFCLGGYRYANFKTAKRAAAIRVSGEALTKAYPTVAAVGGGSERAPVVAGFTWRGGRATDASPLVSLCGKGVVFDSGGYDLKPSAGMLRMKKDMGGAATVLGIARMIMEADLPIRLAVRVGCVENSVSGRAFRPLDVVRSRRGLTVEIGNTDAEGRLVLCDLLAEASDEKPDLLLDCATLTGAARVAVGPDLPALFSNNDGWAEALLRAGMEVADPMWRLPLWDGYDGWLDSPIADVNNVSSKPMAGAITAALFMRRFLAPDTNWAHLDLYAWNDATRPGRPEGGEALGMRAVFAAVQRKFTSA